MRLIFFLSLFCEALFGAYIGHSKCGGRFGDQLVHYLHAKWLSHQSGIPLFYTPFVYSSMLKLDEVEAHLPRDYNLVSFPINARTSLNKAARILYECPYFPSLEEEQNQGGWYAFKVDWKDPAFRKMALSLIEPKEKLDLVTLPADCLSVAIHVREGGGFDTDHTRLYDPLKLPPIEFYIEAMHELIRHFPEKKIYCHIFTDAMDSKTIGETLQEAMKPYENVSIHYRKEGNHHTKNVLEDFFPLFSFDVLIRPRSSFSILPELLHDYLAVYSPAEYIRTGTKIQITRISSSY
jgi:hypothetical protein